MMTSLIQFGLAFSLLSNGSSAFVPLGTKTCHSKRIFATLPDGEQNHIPDRRNAIERIISVTTGAMISLDIFPSIAQAKDESPKKSLSEDYRQGTAALADMEENAPVPKEAYKKLPSGVIYADLRVGSGETVDYRSKCNMQWVLRKSNGYFVDSSEVQGGVPFIFTVGSGEAIAGVDEGIRGMKAGGTRRLLIPPKLAYVKGLEDGLPGPIPAGFGPKQQMRRIQTVRADVPGEYIYLEVQLTRVR